MFDGVPEQFHQFIASSRASSSLQLPLTFPLHGTSNSFPSFDLYSSSSSAHHNHQQIQLQLQQPPPPLQTHGFLHPNFLHHHQQSHHAHKLIDSDDGEREENGSGSVSMSLNVHGERLEEQQQQHEHGNVADGVDDCQWINDEVVALLRVRSDMENWFQDVTWEHVSRKLEDLGYKKSAQCCKAKFEEESRLINNSNNNNDNITYTKNRILSELEEIYHGNPQHNSTQLSSIGNNNEHAIEKPREEEEKQHEQEEEEQQQQHRESLENKMDHHLVEENSVKEQPLQELKSKESDRKRKREEKFGLFKGFCEKIVNQLMTQQEEMHNKLIEDMERRDKEMVEREAAWKKQEMDRFNEKLDLRAQEEAIASNRQATIIEFLKKFASSIDNNNTSGSNSSTSNVGDSHKVTLPYTSNPQTKTTPPSLHVLSHQVSFDSHPPLQENRDGVPIPVPTPVAQHGTNSSSASLILDKNVSSKNPSLPSSPKPNLVPTLNASNNTPKDDIGKRWPKDEVQALINLRCSIDANNDDREAAKAPLWERISQGMLALGYQRSAKRCKEKWENINKYFRKTKDISKKRSLDSRTCPYFHLLSNLYNQKKITMAATPENKQSDIPENRSSLSETHPNQAMQQVEEVGHEGEKNIIQASSGPFGTEF